MSRKYSHYKELFNLGFPIALGQLGIIVVNFADNIMVGHYSSEALSAASFVNNLCYLAVVLGIGFAYGLTPIVASRFAQNKEIRAGIALRHSLLANILVGILLSAIFLFFYFRLDLFNLPAEIIPLIKPYYLLQLLSLMLMVSFGAFKQLFDGAGDTKSPMYIMLISNLLNIVGNYALIFGHWGMPELGLVGAGISTSFSRLFILVALIYLFASKKKWTSCRRGFLMNSWSKRRFLKLIQLGAPVSLQMGLEAAAFVIVVVYVGWLGSKALAAHQIAQSIGNMGFLIYYSIGAAATIIISRQRAQGLVHRLRLTARAALFMSLVVSVVFIAFTLLLRKQLGYIFTTDSEVIRLVSLLLIPLALYQLGDALQIIYSNALRGMMDVRFLVIGALFCYLILAPIISYLLGFHVGITDQAWQLVAIWGAFPISLSLAGLIYYARFRKITQVKPRDKLSK